VILEDIDTAIEPPQNDPVVEQDPAVGSGGGGAGSAAAAAAAVAAAVATAGSVGAVGAVGAAVAGAGTAAAAGSGGNGISEALADPANGIGGGGTASPADQVQCRAGRSPSKVCTELITTSSSPATSGSTSFLDRLISLFTSLSFIGPLTLTFWSMMFPPMSIILTSGIGVVSLLFPWLLPRIWFGRQFSQTFYRNQFDRRFENTNDYRQSYLYH